jgi:hypothetical protein
MNRLSKHRIAPIGKQQYISAKISGDGITDWASELKDKFILKYLGSRPKVLNDLLEKEGSQIISKIEICRVPLSSKFNNLLQWASPTKYEKVMMEQNYDKLFHLFLVFHLENGNIYKLEKNQRVYVKPGDVPKKEGTECRSMEYGLSNLADFITKAENIPGFYRYSPFKDNCQKWVVDLLNTNGIHQYNDFVLQKVDDLVPSYIKTIAQTATDIAGVVDYNIKGGAGYEMHSIVFNKDKWDTNSAREWLKSHNYHPIKRVDITKNTLRYRIIDPKEFVSFITKKREGAGINFVLGMRDVKGGRAGLFGSIINKLNLVPGVRNLPI